MNNKESFQWLLEEFKGWGFGLSCEEEKALEGDVHGACGRGAAVLAEHIINRWEPTIQKDGEEIHLYFGPFRVKIPSPEFLSRMTKDEEGSCYMTPEREYMHYSPWWFDDIDPNDGVPDSAYSVSSS